MCSHQSTFPTPKISEASALWHAGAMEAADRLIVCARKKREPDDNFDADGSERAWVLAQELQDIAQILKMLSSLGPEPAAQIRIVLINRIAVIYSLIESMGC